MIALMDEKASSTKDMPDRWVKVGSDRATHDGDIVSPGGDWREFVIFGAEENGPPDPDVAKFLPKTTSLLEELLPGAVKMAKLGAGEIIFSALAPGTRLLPHCAASNVRLTCHLGLVVPQGARIRVGPEWGGWEEGKCMFFDDSYEHEIVHDGDQMRIVLLIRFWHPELPEDRWLPTLNDGMDLYTRLHSKRLTPPMNAAVAQLVMEPMQKLAAHLGVRPDTDPASLLRKDATDLTAKTG